MALQISVCNQNRIPDEVCSICYESLRDGRIVVIHVNGEQHPLHKVCLLASIHIMPNKCPYCRALIDVSLINPPRVVDRDIFFQDGAPREGNGRRAIRPRNLARVQTSALTSLCGGAGGIAAGGVIGLGTKAVVTVLTAVERGDSWAKTAMVIGKGCSLISGALFNIVAVMNGAVNIPQPSEDELSAFGTMSLGIIGVGVVFGIGLLVSRKMAEKTGGNPEQSGVGAIAGAMTSLLSASLLSNRCHLIPLVGGVIGAIIAGEQPDADAERFI